MPSPVCSVPECDRPQASKGWCDAHYRRWRKTGETPTGAITKRSRPPCAVPGCEHPSASRGWCSGHYQRWHKTGETPTGPLKTDPNRPDCSVEGCDRPAKTKGWCHGHYMRWWYTKQEPVGPLERRRPVPVQCAVDDCDRYAKIGVYCSAHGRRVQRNGGDPGDGSVRAKAGHGLGRVRYVSNGYVFLKAPDHPNAFKNGRIQEHTLVMSEMLGRPLVKGENVHHINGDKLDNRPENLELWLTHQPKGQRVEDLLAWAREITDRYGDIDPKALS